MLKKSAELKNIRRKLPHLKYEHIFHNIFVMENINLAKSNNNFVLIVKNQEHNQTDELKNTFSLKNCCL